MTKPEQSLRGVPRCYSPTLETNPAMHLGSPPRQKIEKLSRRIAFLAIPDVTPYSWFMHGISCIKKNVTKCLKGVEKLSRPVNI